MQHEPTAESAPPPGVATETEAQHPPCECEECRQGGEIIAFLKFAAILLAGLLGVLFLPIACLLCGMALGATMILTVAALIILSCLPEEEEE